MAVLNLNDLSAVLISRASTMSRSHHTTLPINTVQSVPTVVVLDEPLLRTQCTLGEGNNLPVAIQRRLTSPSSIRGDMG